MRRTPTQTRRDGFTLVELLVVITILAILFALASAAVVKVIGKGDEARVRSEISQFNAAVQAFKTQFQAPYLPSHFTIRSTYALNDPDLAYLKTLWPRIGSATASGVTVNWGVLNTAAASNTALDGGQCLVLFLGGPDGVSGFSSSPSDPMRAATAGETRIGPFYDFAVDRLNSAQLRYRDVYGTPYVYFTSYRAGNDYLATDQVKIGGVTIVPYQTTATRFANPNGFQIISAGKDGQFGPGGLNWGGATGGATREGYDDMANFYPTLLGISQ